MTVKELDRTIETVETQVQNCARGEDKLFLMGIIARGTFEVARQIAMLRELLADRP